MKTLAAIVVAALALHPVGDARLPELGVVFEVETTITSVDAPPGAGFAFRGPGVARVAEGRDSRTVELGEVSGRGEWSDGRQRGLEAGQKARLRIDCDGLRNGVHDVGLQGVQAAGMQTLDVAKLSFDRLDASAICKGQ